MLRYTTLVGFGGPEIDRLVADCTIELGLSGLCHNDTSEGFPNCPMVAETSFEGMFNFGQIGRNGAFFIAKHPVTFEATGSELPRWGKV
jgi:hypothetical protein